MSPKKTTIDEVLEAVKAQDVQTGRRFDEVVQKLTVNTEQRFGETLEAIHMLAKQMDDRFEALENRFDSRFEALEGRTGRVEAQMVTKTYLDDKLADVQANLILLTRKEDSKLLALVDLLFGKRPMTKSDRKHIMALEPFAQTH